MEYKIIQIKQCSNEFFIPYVLASCENANLAFSWKEQKEKDTNACGCVFEVEERDK